MNTALKLPDSDALLIIAVMAVLYQNKCDKNLLIAMGLLLLMISSG
ncbi:MAG: hypothetical protein IKK53_00420 [Ruminiclostridium sp.]|nr:hypothetical protein [Ruminiclostridium sp.]